jgi:hypothetical protein
MNVEFESAGALATAALAASEIEGDGPESRSGAAHAAQCANCQAALTGPFCHACGQRAHLHRSLLHLGEELLHGLLHFDAKAWRTLPMLVAKPGRLTRSYIDGQRTRFVSPLALFLFMVFFMFFVVSSVSHESLQTGGPVATSKLDKAIDKTRAKLAHAEARLAAAKAKGEGASDAQAGVDGARSELDDDTIARKLLASHTVTMIPDLKHADELNVDTGMPTVDAAIRHAIANPEFTLYKLKNSASKYSFLLVPITLPFLWLMFFWRRGITMYDHAVFSLYSLSFMALLVTVLALLKAAAPKPLVVFLLFTVPPLHMFLQLRGTYSLGVRSALWRTAVLVSVAAIVFLLYLLLILVLSMSS